MRYDMVYHKGTIDEFDSLVKEDSVLMVNLAFSALAELESNNEMFGGKDSVSYKIKYKKINQRIKRLKKIM